MIYELALINNDRKVQTKLNVVGFFMFLVPETLHCDHEPFLICSLFHFLREKDCRADVMFKGKSFVVKQMKRKEKNCHYLQKIDPSLSIWILFNLTEHTKCITVFIAVQKISFLVSHCCDVVM